MSATENRANGMLPEGQLDQAMDGKPVSGWIRHVVGCGENQTEIAAFYRVRRRIS